MSNLLEISAVSEIKTAKNGNHFVRIDFKGFEDAEGVINMPESKYCWDESLFELLTPGKKVRI